jgi:hypothetical protein
VAEFHNFADDHSIFAALQQSALGTAIQQSTWMFPTIETVHVFALAAVFGSIALVDLRLLGLVSKDRKVTVVTNELLPLTWGAFALAAISGTLLFTSRAADYMHIIEFPTKFVFMALAGVNMLVFHLVTQKSISKWDAGKPILGARVAGGLSLFFWAAVIICARRTGFHL